MIVWERALRLLAVVALGIWLVMAAQVAREVGRTFPGFELDPRGFVWSTTAPAWNGPKHGLRPFDRVIAVDGQPLASPRELATLVATLQPGTPVHYHVERAGRRLALEIPTQRYGAAEAGAALLEGLLPALFFLGVGVAAFWLRPRDLAVQAFLILEVVLSLMVLLNADYGLHKVFNGLLVPSAYCMGGALLLVAVVFPVAPDWLARRPYWALAALVPAVALTLLDRHLDALQPYHGGTYLFAGFTSLCMVALMGRLVSAAWRQPSRLARGRAQVVLLGLTIPGLAIPLDALTTAGVLAPDLGAQLYHLSLAGVVVFPISICYAVLMHRLFDIQILVRRTLVYSGVIGLLTALYFVTAALMRLALPASGSALDEVVATAAVTVLFVPARDRMRDWVQARFFRTGYDFKRTVAAFSEQAQAELEVSKLSQGFLDVVEQALSPAYAGLVLVGEAAETRGAWPALDQPALLAGAAGPPGAATFQLRFQGELLGSAVVGPQKSELDFSEQDVLLLRTLTQQLAVRIRSAILYTQMESLVAIRTAELRKAYDELKQLDELKAGFLNTVSHELRTPLSYIVGFVDALLEGDLGEIPPDQLPALRKIAKGSEQLARLLDDLLDNARMEAGVFKLDLRELDLAALLRDVCMMSATLIDEKQHVVSIVLPDDLPIVRADQARVTQVLNNLISNAVKYTPAGGRLVVGARTEGDMVRVAVTDSGIGIPPDAMDKLFTRFFRVGGQEKGTGLGLSITKALVEGHGGQIGVETEVGRGSTFWFTLPSAPDPRGA
ncbi:MAG: protein of unknown function, putative Histidine kinase [Cyanobacteria bacterium RYN_339]|nr:protein of unknown function, putative Histidine kinase [Cyanobacteria bacterium RYN_339]